MNNGFFTPLAHRALISVGGEDRRTFLQGLVSNDVTKAGETTAIYGAFLTAQGKFLHDFILAERGETLLLEAESARRADFIKRLSLYKLRTKVTISPVDDLRVFAVVGDDAAKAFGLTEHAGIAAPFAGGVVFVDPRLPAAGLRAWLPEGGADALADAGFIAADAEQWDAHRIALGLPDGSRDMAPDKAILLENGFDELGGVDWKKGCYMGQELTARTKYRGLIKKRLMPVEIIGPAPEAGTPILLGESEAGEMHSHSGSLGLAMIRLEQFEHWQSQGGELRAGDTVLRPRKPDWAVF